MNVDHRGLAIGGLVTWIRQAEESIEEMNILRRGIEASRLINKEVEEAKRLQTMLNSTMVDAI